MVFSGSGRHRRPTQADRAVAAAGVASVGLALPLLTAAAAHAAPVSSWDTVAKCESGGHWSRNASDGTYGGLGLTLRTWVEYGGDEFAVQPDHATKEQQIAVAERVLADKGPAAWPGCPMPAAPTAATPAAVTPAAVTPGSPVAVQPSTPPTAPATTAPATPTTPTQPVQNTAPSATPTPVTPTAPTASAPGSVTAPVAPAPADATAAPTTPAPATGTTPAPDPSVSSTPGTATTVPTAPPASPAPDAAAPGTYVVAPGDTLSGISDAHRLGGWKHVYQDNLSAVGGDPDLIHPGQVLHLS